MEMDQKFPNWGPIRPIRTISAIIYEWMSSWKSPELQNILAVSLRRGCGRTSRTDGILLAYFTF